MTLPENAQKELLSRGFLRLVASRSGFIVGSDELDYGSDLSLSHVEAYDLDDDRVRYTKSGFAIDVQLKATCERAVEISDGVIRYDLKAANYNDLVRRQNGNIPLILVLFVLPDDSNSWVGIADSELTLRRCGYFWRPGPEDREVNHTSSKRISIPVANRLQASTFQELREDFLS